MSEDHVAQSLQSDAPPTTAKHQRDIAQAAARAGSCSDDAVAGRKDRRLPLEDAPRGCMTLKEQQSGTTKVAPKPDRQKEAA